MDFRHYLLSFGPVYPMLKEILGNDKNVYLSFKRDIGNTLKGCIRLEQGKLCFFNVFYFVNFPESRNKIA